MPLNHLERKSPPQEAAQFKVVDCFTYPGIQIVPQLENIVAVLYLPYDRGGLKCPNPLWYYWAAVENADVLLFRRGSPSLEGD